MQKYKVTKLDRRHNGYSFYKYSISPIERDYIKSRQDLIELRNCCWETYGPGAEIGWIQNNNTWAWDTEHGNKRLYVKSDTELIFLELKFN